MNSKIHANNFKCVHFILRNLKWQSKDKPWKKGQNFVFQHLKDTTDYKRAPFPCLNRRPHIFTLPENKKSCSQPCSNKYFVYNFMRIPDPYKVTRGYVCLCACVHALVCMCVCYFYIIKS